MRCVNALVWICVCVCVRIRLHRLPSQRNRFPTNQQYWCYVQAEPRQQSPRTQIKVLITAGPFPNGCNQELGWKLNDGGIYRVVELCKHSSIKD